MADDVPRIDPPPSLREPSIPRDRRLSAINRMVKKIGLSINSQNSSETSSDSEFSTPTDRRTSSGASSPETIVQRSPTLSAPSSQEPSSQLSSSQENTTPSLSIPQRRGRRAWSSSQATSRASPKALFGNFSFRTAKPQSKEKGISNGSGQCSPTDTRFGRFASRDGEHGTDGTHGTAREGDRTPWMRSSSNGFFVHGVEEYRAVRKDNGLENVELDEFERERAPPSRSCLVNLENRRRTEERKDWTGEEDGA